MMTSMQHLNADLTKEQQTEYKRLVGQRISLNLIGKLVGVGRRAISIEIEEWDGNTVRLNIAPLGALVSSTGKAG